MNESLSYTYDLIHNVDRGVDEETLDAVIGLAIEIAREGREGRKIGTLLVVGDAENVMLRSRAMILDPLAGHPPQRKRLDDPNLRETVKELAQLDGAFVVSDDGVVLSACRYLSAPAEGIEVRLGLGSRHVAAAAISSETTAVAVVVSESSVVRVFDDGEMIAEIIPELWMMSRYGRFPAATPAPRSESAGAEMRIITKGASA